VKCTLNTDVIDRITDNLGTSVQPNWLAEDVASSSSSSSVMTASQDVLYHNWALLSRPSQVDGLCLLSKSCPSMTSSLRWKISSKESRKQKRCAGSEDPAWCSEECGVVWCGVVWCGVVWCGVVWCGVVWCGVVWCGVVWCGAVRCGVVRVYLCESPKALKAAGHSCSEAALPSQGGEQQAVLGRVGLVGPVGPAELLNGLVGRPGQL